MTGPLNAPLRLAFIGGATHSAVGFAHFNASRLDGHFRLEAGCFSRDAERNAHSAGIYGIAPERVYPDAGRLIAAETGRIDALVVLTPTPAHLPDILAALEAGIPVISEKALACSVEECQRIEDAVLRTRGYLAVTYNYSGYPMVREIRRLIRTGQLGTLHQIQIEMPQEGYLRAGANPQDWRKVDYAVPTVSLDLGVHVHHLVDFLTDGSRPLRVVGDEASYGPFSDLIDNVYCIAHYEHDVRVSAWWGKTALGLRNGLRIRVYGSEASAEWLQTEPENLLWADHTGRRSILDRGGEGGIALEPRYNRFKAGHPSGFIEAFANLYADIAEELRSLHSQSFEPSGFVYGADQAKQGLAMLGAISVSARQKTWLEIESSLSA